MLNLDLFSGSRWIDLTGAVRIEVLPMGMTMMMEAYQDPDLPPPDDEGRRDLPEPMVIRAVARLAIVAWEGVGDGSGRAVAVSRERIDALLQVPACFMAFREKYYLAGMKVVAEGNASGSSPSGTTAGGGRPATVRAAKASARPARKGSTSPKAGKAGRSGT